MIISWKARECCVYLQEDLYGLGAGGIPSAENVVGNNSEAATALIRAAVVLRKTQSRNAVSGHLCYSYNPSYSNDIYPVAVTSIAAFNDFFQVFHEATNRNNLRAITLMKMVTAKIVATMAQ